ncbi:hypothetical protein MRX96_014491 [Rhipicephalus microplus]
MHGACFLSFFPAVIFLTPSFLKHAPWTPNAFLEEIRLYPFLYDKTMPDYKDKEAKMNRWDLIGSMFGLTGTQAMLKFKNIRDRWMKLVSGVEANTRSGAPGNNGIIKWPLFSIIDSMLRQTPHYAEK